LHLPNKHFLASTGVVLSGWFVSVVIVF